MSKFAYVPLVHDRRCTGCGTVINMGYVFRYCKGAGPILTVWCSDPPCTPLDKKYSDFLLKHTKQGHVDLPLSFEEFNEIAYSACEYCGDESYGVSRHDHNLGWISGNCYSTCNSCGWMKGKTDRSRFLEQIAKIYNYSLS